MECGFSVEEKADFLIYCFEHAAVHHLPFAGKTLKDLFALAGEAAPDGLDDDRAYTFVTDDEIIELVVKAQENLQNMPRATLRLVKNG